MNFTLRVLGLEVLAISLWQDAEAEAPAESPSLSFGFACADLAPVPPLSWAEEVWR